MIDFEKVEEAKKQIKFSNEGLLRLSNTAKNLKLRPSEFLGIEDEHFALALDMACAEQFAKSELTRGIDLFMRNFVSLMNSDEFKEMQRNAFKNAAELYFKIAADSKHAINTFENNWYYEYRNKRTKQENSYRNDSGRA